MTIFSISDLHLSDGDKPMDVFGEHWLNHFSKIREDWVEKVTSDDVVLMPGDLSWAMQLEDAVVHLRLIDELPGVKIIIKGNHDFWWSSVSRLRSILPKSVMAIQNDSVFLNGVLFCGSRGWVLPGNDSAASDIKIFDRELIRLEMSLASARRRSESADIICMAHYPPTFGSDTPVTSLLDKYRVKTLVYGHLHGQSLRTAFNGTINSVTYKCVSCDGLDFKLSKICEA